MADLCIACNLHLRQRQEILCCISCLGKQHRKCNSGISREEYRRMRSQGQAVFQCVECIEATVPYSEVTTTTGGITQRRDFTPGTVYQRSRRHLPSHREYFTTREEETCVKRWIFLCGEEGEQEWIHPGAPHFVGFLQRRRHRWRSSTPHLRIRSTTTTPCFSKDVMDYSQQDGVFKFVRKLLALPFLPEEQIPVAFNTLKETVTSEQLIQLTNGDIRTPSSWTVYRMAVRTNNDVEGWHHRINRRAQKSSLSFYVLVILLFKPPASRTN
ncbi:hypothetical protein KUTeg_008969 [Tegillarca granosa]|uniref:Uncharacterized protein n=1 Tax=Tegillarca granosa TaxID=220873 RepID=A0ABQ9F7Y6_TEGGR|nr:hypothetical protein KUTeg_008969 [Tegillarca granosa]